ncbi:MAG: hypothetical protein JWP26_4292 [Devosia sp.]|uniref:hypothetical protein n=1 Tax=Devosia sp. TaxID=1871048 RepID=UPI00260CC9EF|nr:hypothetical protein [Devosia sp.]MDB5589322.1 hypothetical protein [Devosia sp.]
MTSYWKTVVPLYLSLVVSFALPIVEALAVEKIDIVFLAYLGLVIPLAVIISTSARIYAQSDVFSHGFAPDQDGVAATVRTAIVSLAVYVPAMMWLHFVAPWPQERPLWSLLLSVFLFSSVLQAPRMVAQAMSTGGRTSRTVLVSSVIMVVSAALLNTAIVLLVRDADTGIALSIAANIVSVSAASGYVWVKVFAGSETRGVLARALRGFDIRNLKTLAFAVIESLSYNAFFYVFATALLAISVDSAAKFNFISSLCLIAVAWRLTFSIILQSAFSKPLGVSEHYRLFIKMVGAGLAHVVPSLALIWLFITTMTDIQDFQSEFAALSAIMLLGTFNQIALAGLRAKNAMGRMAMLSVLSNVVGGSVILWWGGDAALAGLLIVAVCDELFRTTMSTLMLYRVVARPAPVLVQTPG